MLIPSIVTVNSTGVQECYLIRANEVYNTVRLGGVKVVIRFEVVFQQLSCSSRTLSFMYWRAFYVVVY